MCIPRKRASLEMLRDGLDEFGVTGEFLKRAVTHDELDAITAAVVGAFFWRGKFEALGSQDEEALIIPDLKVDARPWLEKRVIGISGAVAAGKTSSARHLESLGFRYARYSMVLQRILEERGLKSARIDLQEFGDQVHNEYGQRWLGRRMLESLPKEGNLVIDGLRFPDDHAFLVETFGPAFRHLHITAERHARDARYERREGGSESLQEAEAHSVEGQISSLFSLAHIVIANDDTLESLHGKIEASVCC
jgi:dephospho-CoA kinase